MDVPSRADEGLRRGDSDRSRSSLRESTGQRIAARTPFPGTAEKLMRQLLARDRRHVCSPRPNEGIEPIGYDSRNRVALETAASVAQLGVAKER